MSCNRLVKAITKLINVDEIAEKIEEIYGEADDDMSCKEITELAKSGQVQITVGVTCYDRNGDYVGEDEVECEQSEDDFDDE